MNKIALHLGVDRATVLRYLRIVHAAAQQPGNSTSLIPEPGAREA